MLQHQAMAGTANDGGIRRRWGQFCGRCGATWKRLKLTNFPRAVTASPFAVSKCHAGSAAAAH
ncbi:hypothetical protein CWR43_19190 [Rhizobium sullae]|uniref:Uncharacterized protein n=1 Tax=Rhizobium sullae TaxID=50338 RepID=A0A2N0D7Z7_RHISU|nr:hypothetical protein CWR43_19190 [Rhizobium sullae]